MRSLTGWSEPQCKQWMHSRREQTGQHMLNLSLLPSLCTVPSQDETHLLLTRLLYVYTSDTLSKQSKVNANMEISQKYA